MVGVDSDSVMGNAFFEIMRRVPDLFKSSLAATISLEKTPMIGTFQQVYKYHECMSIFISPYMAAQ